MASNQTNKTSLNNNTRINSANLGNPSANLNTRNNKSTTTINTTSNNATFYTKVKQQATTLTPITIFIIVLIVVILGYISVTYAYNKVVNTRPIKVSENVLLDTITDAMVPLDISSSQLPNSSYSNEYALSLWVYVDNFNYRHGERKFILRRGDIKSVVNPEIYLHPTQNTLQVNVSLATDLSGNMTQSTNSPPTTTISETTTTTVPETTSNVAAFVNVESFVNAEPFVNASELVSSPTLAVNGDDMADTVKDMQYYNNGFFNDVVNNNMVNYPNQPAHHKRIGHNPELNLVMEQFSDPENCNCDNTRSLDESPEDRKNFEDKCGKCFVDHFPLQKWVHLVVSQYNNVVDIYVDGKLNSSCSLHGFPDVTTDNLVLSPDGGFSGQMGNTVYYNTALSAVDVHKIYSKGPEGARQSGVVSKLQQVPMWVYVVVVLIIIGIVVYTFIM